MLPRSYAIENERVMAEVEVKEAAGIQKSRIVTLSYYLLQLEHPEFICLHVIFMFMFNQL